jgi:hypothetical protein
MIAFEYRQPDLIFNRKDPDYKNADTAKTLRKHLIHTK